AYAGRNQITNAEAELKTLEAVTKTIPLDASFGNSTAGDVLKVADQMLAGKIAFARGDLKAALALLNQAAQTEDAVSYNEPPDWDLPVCELLGGVLLLNEEYVEAERVFRAEIAKHRRNGRALFGLVESLKRQNKNSSALMVQRELEQAWETADTKLRVEDLAGMNSKVEPVSINRRGRDLHFRNPLIYKLSVPHGGVSTGCHPYKNMPRGESSSQAPNHSHRTTAYAHPLEAHALV
ncbi:MAG: hypothetical protein ACRD6N_06110, partial [Pyrinomonadaceae bacterium]